MNETSPPSSAAPRSKPDYSRLEYIPAFVAADSATPTATAAPARIDWSEVPLIDLVDAATQQQLEREAKRRRWSEVLGLARLLGLAAAALVAFLLLIEAAQFFGNDRPPVEILAAESARVGAEVLRRFTVPGQSLVAKDARAELFQIPSRGRAEYDIVVTLELRAPLYAPAESNGVQQYLQLQRSLRDAHARMLARGLFRDRGDLAHPPVLPPIFSLAHRAGETLVVKVPLEARRGGWSWKLQPSFAQWRENGARFVGEEIGRLPPQRLIFGTAATREEMRRLTGEARSYIVAVRAALSDGT